ncbi:MAG: HEPN domain-containing protein [Candidatus Babeliales bacterium]|jgi:HEPN domain-containing protein
MKKKSLEWLHFAKIDYEAAKNLLNSDLLFVGVAAYHSQQSAEKSLKAFLIFSGHGVTKTHDLEILLKQCMAFDYEFKCLEKNADSLNPFSVQTRYPDDVGFMLSPEEAAQLIEYAENILLFVRTKIG